jgi:hypothetical protein
MPAFRVAVFTKETIKGQEQSAQCLDLIFETEDQEQALCFGVEQEALGNFVIVYDPLNY